MWWEITIDMRTGKRVITTNRLEAVQAIINRIDQLVDDDAILIKRYYPEKGGDRPVS